MCVYMVVLGKVIVGRVIEFLVLSQPFLFEAVVIIQKSFFLAT